MAFFDKLKDSISTASQDISQKAKTASENMRISNQIRANEKMIDKLTHQVGLRCVENHLYDADSEYGDLFSEIIRLHEENVKCQEELNRLAASKICPQCGRANNADAKFCLGCGAPLGDAVMPDSGKFCPSCGALNTEDSAFCMECGTSLADVAPISAGADQAYDPSYGQSFDEAFDQSKEEGEK